MKKVLKRMQAFMLVVSMCVGLISTNVYAEEGMTLSTEQVVSEEEFVENEQSQELLDGVADVPSDVYEYEADGYKVISTLSSSWEGGFNADIVIQNTGANDIKDWHVAFPAQYEISNIWNAAIVSCEDGTYLIKNADWNETIASGNCVQFGMTVNENFVGFPSIYEVTGTGTDDGVADVATDVYEYETEGYKVISILSSSWEGGFSADIVIENTGDSDIRNWYITIPTQYEISNIWDATILSYEDGEYLIKNADWNGMIAPESRVQFGITVNESFVGFPNIYEIVGTSAEESGDNYTIVYSADNVWDTGFTGSIVINNISDKAIEDWVLEFDFENEFSDVWNATIISHEGIHYVLRNAEYNCDINAGESITIGFAVNDGDFGKSASNFSLTSFVLKQEPMGEEEDKDPLKDLTESYIKPATEEDIIFDENEGIYYVKNQVMVSAYLGTPKEAIEKIAEDIGAEIVGYIALIEEYQLEFKEPMTYSELMDMVEYLEGIPYVEYAELNLATPCEPQYFSNDALYNSGELWKTSSVDSNNDGRYDDTEKQNTKTQGADDGWKKFNPDGNNWGLEALNVHGAWDYRTSYQGTVKVGIYDNMFGENPDLDYAQRINNPTTIDKVHGTHVAGTIGAKFDNGIGISGVATDVKLYGYAVANSSASYAQIFTKLIENDVRVINVSYGFSDEIVYAATKTDGTGDKAQKMIKREADSLSNKLKKLIVQGYDFLIVCSAGNGNGKDYVKDSSAQYGYAKYDSIKHSNLKPTKGSPDPFYNYHLTAITDEVVSSRIMVVGAVGHSMVGYRTEYEVASFSNEGSRVDVYAPGVDILSTVPQSGFCDPYMTLSGTSMAAPHISGLAALILQANPELTAQQIKDIIKKNNGAQIGTTGKYMPDAEKCIVEALGKPGGGTDTTLPQGILKGKAVNSEGKELEGLTVLLVRTSTGQSNLGDYYFTTETKSDGSFELKLPQGTYEMVIYGETFVDGAVMPFKTSNIVIEPDTEKYLETTVLFMSFADEIGESCNISGIIYDALSGKPVEGATIKARSGWNTFNGPYVTGLFDTIKEDTSDANGVFDIKAVHVGQYTVEIKKNGYVIGYFNMISQRETDEARQAVILTPELSDGEYRAVLTWGATPRDLDSHLTYYEGNTQKMHVYYGAKIGTVDGVKVAELDLDDTSGYGPETVTLTFKQDSFGNNEKFVYSVHNFSNGSDSTSTALSQSGAIVRLYCGNNIAETFYVPANKTGTVWQVFEMDKNGVHPINAFYSASASGVR